MKRLGVLVLACALSAPAGCYRTRYANLSAGNLPVSASPPAPQTPPPSSWRHFFIYGWVPGERRIDAATECGGAERVEAIETEQTVVQWLIHVFASYKINIYSPWTARVVCKQP